MKTRVYRKKEVFEIDFREIISKVCAEFSWRRNPKLVSFLKSLEIEGRLFEFIYDGDMFFKVYVVCPKCKKNKLKLYRIEDKYGCQSCNQVKNAKPRRRGLIYTRYVRPLRKLVEVERKLLDDTLTLRQRQVYEKKAAKLLKVIPEYIVALKDKLLDESE